MFIKRTFIKKTIKLERDTASDLDMLYEEN